ncbi:MAG: transcriptional regulator [Pseudomonadota bacterium]
MPLTHDFRETVKARADREPAFRQALLQEAVELLLEGDVAIGKALLRDYINATIGFGALSEQVGIPAKSLMRMVSARGNPRSDKLFAMLACLQKATGVQLAFSHGKQAA